MKETPNKAAFIFVLTWNLWILYTLMTTSCGPYWQPPNRLNIIEGLTALFYFGAFVFCFCIYLFEERRAIHLLLTFAFFILFTEQIDWGQPLLDSAHYVRDADPISATWVRFVFKGLELAAFILTPLWIQTHLYVKMFWPAWIPLLIREEFATLVNGYILPLDYCYGALPQLNELLTATSLMYFSLVLHWGIRRHKQNPKITD